ncbi:hypothetical protein ACFE04_023546 [Oxalis oulophora]
MGGNQFIVRIRDTHGVEIEYENCMIDNSRWYQCKNKFTAPTPCKMFGEEEATDGYLALPGIWGKHFKDFTMREVFLLVSDGSRWAIETRSFNDGTIRSFGVEFPKLIKQYGISNNCRAIFDYGEESPFYFRLVDKDEIEIEYEGADKGKRKKNISTLASSQDTNNTIVFLESSDMDNDFDEFDIVESGDTEMVIDGTNTNEQVSLGQIEYCKGFFMGGIFGEKGAPGFMKKMTTAVCRRM